MRSRCEMTAACLCPIAYVDAKGFIYCEFHGKQRKSYVSCRKLSPAEIKRIKTLDDEKVSK